MNQTSSNMCWKLSKSKCLTCRPLHRTTLNIIKHEPNITKHVLDAAQELMLYRVNHFIIQPWTIFKILLNVGNIWRCLMFEQCLMFKKMSSRNCCDVWLRLNTMFGYVLCSVNIIKQMLDDFRMTTFYRVDGPWSYLINIKCQILFRKRVQRFPASSFTYKSEVKHKTIYTSLPPNTWILVV